MEESEKRENLGGHYEWLAKSGYLINRRKGKECTRGFLQALNNNNNNKFLLLLTAYYMS